MCVDFAVALGPNKSSVVALDANLSTLIDQLEEGVLFMETIVQIDLVFRVHRDVFSIVGFDRDLVAVLLDVEVPVSGQVVLGSQFFPFGGEIMPVMILERFLSHSFLFLLVVE